MYGNPPKVFTFVCFSVAIPTEHCILALSMYTFSASIYCPDDHSLCFMLVPASIHKIPLPAYFLVRGLAKLRVLISLLHYAVFFVNCDDKGKQGTSQDKLEQM